MDIMSNKKNKILFINWESVNKSISGQEKVYRSSPVITQRENHLQPREFEWFALILYTNQRKRLTLNKSYRKLHPGVYIWKMHVKNVGVYVFMFII